MVCQLSRIRQGRTRYIYVNAQAVTAGNVTVTAAVITPSGVQKGKAKDAENFSVMVRGSWPVEAQVV